jgi:type II secretory pathway pseudopilin PulG
MQRKNNFLNPLKKRGFAMIMAIILIVILSTIMAYTLTLTTQTTKQTGDLYLREQAVLLAQSAAEYTLLAISGQARGTNGNTTCLGGVNGTYPNATNPIFDINVSVGYIGLNCVNFIGNGYNYISTITTPESNGTVLLDITVTTHDGNISTEPIRYFRRTIQKL